MCLEIVGQFALLGVGRAQRFDALLLCLCPCPQANRFLSKVCILLHPTDQEHCRRLQEGDEACTDKERKRGHLAILKAIAKEENEQDTDKREQCRDGIPLPTCRSGNFALAN